MRPFARFLVLLLLGLALLTWGVSWVVERTTHGWFQKDIELRSQLVMSGARQALVSATSAGDRVALGKLLEEITRDERIIGAAVFDKNASLLVKTREYPSSLGSGDPSAYACPVPPDQEVWKPLHMGATIPTGTIHISTIPFAEGDDLLGFLVLVHDMSFAERRGAKTQRFLVLTFALLAVTASVLTLAAARLSWRSWKKQLRNFLQGGEHRPEFQPIVQDVRELLDQITAERQQEMGGRAWTPQRLKETMWRHLHGERI